MSKIKQIDHSLWQGAFSDVAVEGIPEEVEIVILMASTADLPPLRPGQILIYYPIDDTADGASAEELYNIQRIASTFADRKVLTVCYMGENRSGLMSAMILLERYDDASWAVKTVQERGPVNSGCALQSFWNPGFVQQILAFNAIS